jgi:uncharacterized protein with beta-barrel porin domain
MRLAFVLLGFSISGFATDVYWNDFVNGSSWNYSTHWSPPGIPGPSDTAIFNPIGPNFPDLLKISIIAPTLVGSLEFNNTNPHSSYWIYGANPLQFNASSGNSSIVVAATNQSQTLFDTAIILSKNLDVSNRSNQKIIFSKTISGVGRGLSVSGLVEFSGNTSNTYTETTHVRNGTLFLNKTSGVNAIAGNLVVNSGHVETLNSQQFPPTSSVTLREHSTIRFTQDTIQKLILESGIHPNTISIDRNLSITELLELADLSSIVGSGTLSVAGDISFIGSSRNAHIDTPLLLSNQLRSISVDSVARLSINSPISEGGIIKTGPGILDILSTANLSGLVIEEGGIHLNGSLVSASPIQIYPEAFLYGKGIIDGDLVIQGTVSLGDVALENSTYTETGYFTFDKVGEISQKEVLFLTGDFSSSEISEGIHVNGDIIFSPSSTLIVKFSPTMLSQIDTDGKIILDSANVLLSPSEGFYKLNQTYNLLYAGSIEGQFGTVSSRFPLLNPMISYITEDSYSGVSFSLSLNRFSDLFATGNTAEVGNYLDTLAADPSDNSPIILEALINISSVEDLEQALSHLHPSCFTSLSVAQENDLLYIRNAIYNRLLQDQQNCCFTEEKKQSLQLWGGLIGGSAHQTNQNREPGYLARSPGAILGLDAQVNENTIFGGACGYIYTFQEWKRRHGDANMHTIYGSIYSQYAKPTSFFTANMTGGYTFYDVDRNLHLGALHAKAHSHFGGFEGAIDLKMGAHFPVLAAIMTPFLAFDYMVVHQNSTKEEGARVLNLKIKDHTADLLTSEAGFEFNFCHWKNQTLLKALLKMSVVGESRFFGRYEKASFPTGGTFKVKGWYPSRVLGAFGSALSASVYKSTISLCYQAKTNWDFTDQFLTLEVLWKF